MKLLKKINQGTRESKPKLYNLTSKRLRIIATVFAVVLMTGISSVANNPSRDSYGIGRVHAADALLPPSGCSLVGSVGEDFVASVTSYGCSYGSLPIRYSFSYSYNWTTNHNSCSGGGGGAAFSLANPAGNVSVNFYMIAANTAGSSGPYIWSSSIGVGNGTQCY